jgi:hypothetical protein
LERYRVSAMNFEGERVERKRSLIPTLRRTPRMG